jgi:hypothetical protein
MEENIFQIFRELVPRIYKELKLKQQKNNPVNKRTSWTFQMKKDKLLTNAWKKCLISLATMEMVPNWNGNHEGNKQQMLVRMCGWTKNCWLESKLVKPLWKSTWTFLKNNKNSASIITSDIYPKESKPAYYQRYLDFLWQHCSQ